jgi:hypothetical protein|tara:strand:- start:1371 stop:1994 length:624 start_codon:yes stop_codon:yes gene_type:complete
MFKKSLKKYLVLLLSCFVLEAQNAFSQSTTNQSTVSNSAAPSASSVTTGGTNVNTQVNNAYANDLGFGGGITCRTPKLFMTGNVGKVDAYQIDPLQDVHNQNNNYQFTAGVVIPFMSKLNRYCKEIAGEITKDRKIASELSMIKACDDLLKKNIRVDPIQFPLLAPCEDYRAMMEKVAQVSPKEQPSQSKKKSLPLPALKPVTDRAL